MKLIKTLCFFYVCCLLTTGCTSRSGGDMWDDTRSCGRHVSRGFGTLGGKCGDSRQVYNRDDFCCPVNDNYYVTEFEPLQDEHGKDMIAMESVPQAKQSPGDPGSSVPGIDAFRNPDQDSVLGKIFQHVNFPYDSDAILGQENLRRVRAMAAYLKSHPNMYVFVEGHCDERGPQAYNLALGMRRSNSMRRLLVAEGVNPEHLFPVSYGKERPIKMGHGEDVWKVNRRAQFKVYER